MNNQVEAYISTAEKTSKKSKKSVSKKWASAIALVILLMGTTIYFALKSSSSAKNEEIITTGKSSSSFVPTVVVTKAAPAYLPLSADAFGVSQVQDQLNFNIITTGISYSEDTKTSFSCVDARNNDPMFGTPGGDLGEFAAGLSAYYANLKSTPTLESVRTLFKAFMKKEISPERPFYYHTDDTRLKRVFANVSLALGGKAVTILPSSTPVDSEKKVWLEELTSSDAQGCGHIRLMIASPGKYGLPTADVIKFVIQVFYEEWWAAPSSEKTKFRFDSKLGPLVGKAIAIIDNASECQGNGGYSPMVIGSLGGSSMFIYHGAAVGKFREKVLAPFLVEQSNGLIKNGEVEFTAEVNALQATQLTATLKDLSPANAVDLFSASFSCK